MEEEISLSDYLKILFLRKKVFLTVFLLVFISTVAFTFLSKKIYKGELILEVGKIYKVENLEELKEEFPFEMAESLPSLSLKIEKGAYDLKIKEKLKIEKDYPQLKARSIKNTRFLIISAFGPDQKTIKKVLQALGEIILKEHQGKIERNLKILEEAIKRIENEISLLEKKEQKIEKENQLLEKISPEERTLAISLSIKENEKRLLEIKREKEILSFKLKSFKALKEKVNFSKIIKKVEVSSSPIRPKKFLNITIGFFLALVLAIFSSFLFDWWQKNKSKILSS